MPDAGQPTTCPTCQHQRHPFAACYAQHGIDPAGRPALCDCQEALAGRGATPWTCACGTALITCECGDKRCPTCDPTCEVEGALRHRNAFLPHSKYRVVSQDHGWSMQVWDDQQPAEEGRVPPSECELACQDADRHVTGCPTLGDPVTLTGQPRGVWPSPEDVCDCGDYRKQHAGPQQRGSCLVCRNGTPPPLGADGCQRFAMTAPARKPS